VLAVLAPGAMAAGFPWGQFARKPADWYRSEEAARALENVLSNQSEQGDWPKNFDTSAQPGEPDRSKIHGTFDNGATVGEIRFLARAYNATGEARYRDAALKALDHVLAAQYPNGGFPQTFPPGTGYARHITFNDGTMVNLLELSRDVSRPDDFRFVDSRRREAAARAFDKGIACILACQVKVNDRLTVWCAQHDESTLEPRGARTYELPSLSGGESAGILDLLMNLDDPSPAFVRAIDAGARWYDDSKIRGIRQETRNGDKAIVPDPAAPPLWARFYEIDTNRPFFCGRDGIKKYDLSEIEAERRNGYAWYGNWGERVGAAYEKWKQRRRTEAR
jgi:pectate lyase